MSIIFYGFNCLLYLSQAADGIGSLKHSFGCEEELKTSPKPISEIDGMLYFNNIHQ